MVDEPGQGARSFGHSRKVGHSHEIESQAKDANTGGSRYHGEGDPNHPVVQLEMDEMRDAIRTSGSDKVHTVCYSSPSLSS